MLRRIFLYVIFLDACLINTPAQEVITGLQSNYSITSNILKENKGFTSSDTLLLPFFDDFSGHSIFPDSKKWTDNYVFINNTYSDRQITAGIATFDALDNTGRMYATASSSGFKADQLTSQPINLNYSVSDNIWLSFFYQAGGLADAGGLAGGDDDRAGGRHVAYGQPRGDHAAPVGLRNAGRAHGHLH